MKLMNREICVEYMAPGKLRAEAYCCADLTQLTVNSLDVSERRAGCHGRPAKISVT